ncbi:O-antigen polymerase [Nafulsella turpanensis]|uniref:O-antigen polymerase n=1 Tax=Nafulsella turpanensis TaxID=1265690 RepID=UPI0003499BB0|nr:O-antigen polymerase [Nafulsella turpanensis]
MTKTTGTALVLKWLPYVVFSLINEINDLLFEPITNVTVDFELIFLVWIVYFVSTRLCNKYNKIIVQGWLLFFVLGILNINSVRMRTNVWNLEVYDASLLYLFCLVILSVSLFLLEKRKKKGAVKGRIAYFRNDFGEVTYSLFSMFILVFPLLLFVSVVYNIGYIPIMSGESFVEEMYHFNYGPLYGYKFVCVYSFLIVFLILKTKRGNQIIPISYIILLFFILSIDGKRFLLLLCFVAFIPVFYFINVQGKKVDTWFPIIVASVSISGIYILLNVIRTGGDLQESLTSIFENLPFGVEYKDYVHSFNTYGGPIAGYSYELSSVGAFFNSEMLRLLGLNKEELVMMGSANIWMKLYNEEFGIRTGIISELYFAYNYFVLVMMVPLAYFLNLISHRLENPRSFFNLVQNSIIFSLIFFLINGQSTVFFGCLTIVIYIFIIFKALKLIFPKRKRNDIYSYTSIQ